MSDKRIEISEKEFSRRIKKYEDLGWRFKTPEDLGDDHNFYAFNSPRMRKNEWRESWYLMVGWMGKTVYYFDEEEFLKEEAAFLAKKWVGANYITTTFIDTLEKVLTDLYKNNNELALTPTEVLISAAKEFKK